MSDKPKTVEVRIEVSVDEHGYAWCEHQGFGDMTGPTDGDTTKHIVTASLPIPQPQEVEGQVSDGSQ